MDDYFNSKYYAANKLGDKCRNLVKRNMPTEYMYSSSIYEGFKTFYDTFDSELTGLVLCLMDSEDVKYEKEMQRLACEYALKMTVRYSIVAYGLPENPFTSTTHEHMIESECKELNMKYIPYEKDKEEIYKELLVGLNMDERKQALWALCKVYFTKAVKDLEKAHVCCNVNWHTAVYFYEHEFKPADIKIDVNNWAKIAYLTTLTNKLIDKYIDTDRDVQVSTKQMLDKAHEHVNKYMGECGMDFGFKVVDIAFTGVHHN